jgi:hypothetical protein
MPPHWYTLIQPWDSMGQATMPSVYPDATLVRPTLSDSVSRAACSNVCNFFRNHPLPLFNWKHSITSSCACGLTCDMLAPDGRDCPRTHSSLSRPSSPTASHFRSAGGPLCSRGSLMTAMRCSAPSPLLQVCGSEWVSCAIPHSLSVRFGEARSRFVNLGVRACAHEAAGLHEDWCRRYTSPNKL